MTQNHNFTFNLRHQELQHDTGGHNEWREIVTPRAVAANQTAIIICDMWDKHWSRGANERVGEMVGRMEQVVSAARQHGALIIHAPSETMAFYADDPAHQRVLAELPVPPPPDLEHAIPPLPVDASDHGSDTGETQTYRAWSRQHAALTINQSQDMISDNGQQIYSILQNRGIAQVLIMGVHTNMCVLNRSFAIKQMVKWGVAIALVRDLTDAMYNPARFPYVSHADGTRLVIEYIEKFWCPSVLSTEIL